MKKKKNGSALIYVILLLSVLFTVCVGVMEISLTSLKQSTNYNNKNSAFYHADNTLERIIYYIDLAADDARKKANDYCFLPGGGPNLESEKIKDLYQTYLNNLYVIEESLDKTDIEKKKEKALEEFNKSLKNIFVEEYETKLEKFFKDKNSEGKLSININGILTDYNWYTLKESFLKSQINSNDGIQITFKTYGEVSSGDEFEDFKKGITDSSKFENFSTSDNAYPRETLYIKVHMNKKGITRYLTSTFEMNPFGVELEKVAINTGIIKRGYNKLLDYGLASDRNLIVVNGDSKFNVNGEVYVKGTSNNINEIKTSDNFGGIIVGMDSDALLKLKNASVNKVDNDENIAAGTGNLSIKGNTYVGNTVRDNNDNKFTGGFVKTLGSGSKIDIDGDLYSHSIITEKSAANSNIKINGNSYIADNVSLNASNSSINIVKSLIGFETADSNTNYNQSPSIVVNNQTSTLSVGENIVLFGVAFIEGVTRSGDAKLFRTVETSSIYPNYLGYTYHIQDNNKFDNFYSIYSFENSDTQPDMFDRDKVGEVVKVDDGVNFLLQYIKGSIKQPEIYDNPYNFAYNESPKHTIINAPNMKFNPDDEYNTSYFSALLTANNKVYVRNMEIDNEKEIKDTLVEATKNADNGKYFKANEVNAELQSKLIAKGGPLDKIKTDFVNRINISDKGIANSTGMDSYVDWNKLTAENVILKSLDGKYFIWISNNDIHMNVDEYKGFNILIVSKKNIFLNSKGDSSVTGNIIAKGDIVVTGGNMTLNHNVDISKRLMNYFTQAETAKCQEMSRFFAKGVTNATTYDTEVTSAFKKSVKTNIKILSRRQIVK